MSEEIRYCKGTDQLDEVLLDNVDVHIEQLDTDCYWLCFTRHGDPTYGRLVVNIGPAGHVKRKTPLNGYITENDLGIKEDR